MNAAVAVSSDDLGAFVMALSPGVGAVETCRIWVPLMRAMRTPFSQLASISCAHVRHRNPVRLAVLCSGCVLLPASSPAMS